MIHQSYCSNMKSLPQHNQPNGFELFSNDPKHDRFSDYRAIFQMSIKIDAFLK